MASFDAIVLGAGMVGVSTAIQLRKRGLSVAIVDRRAPGEETSFGNAGIIQREGVHPYMFPRDIRSIVDVALKRRTDANYHLTSLAHVAPFLWRYFLASSKEGGRRTLEANIPLFARCLEAHQALMSEAGSEALVARKGWIRLFRTDDALRGEERHIRELRELGLGVDTLDSAAINALEPHVATGDLSGGLHYRDPWTCSDPGALVKSYAQLLDDLGGEIVAAQVSGVDRTGNGWSVRTDGPELSAGHVVVTLGPWSKRLLDELGVKLPMGVKRGYHQHYTPLRDAVLSRPVVDDTYGFVLASMARGIRITSGAEFARHHALKTPVQLRRVLPVARKLFPLGESVDDEPWMGARPVFPDMLPVIGPASQGTPGLWLHFGHGHHGFTLGPATGELMAQMIAGETPYCDPAPYSAARFSRPAGQ